MPKRSQSDERGQAYTLEGFTAAAIVLFALLFALQSLVITPGTGGGVDRTAQSQLQQEAQDALIVAAHAEDGNGTLSELAREWTDGGGFESEEVFTESVLGQILDQHVLEPAQPETYRVDLIYLNDSDDTLVDKTESKFVAGTNDTDPNAVTASYTVAIFEYQNVTEYDSGEFDETETPITDENSEIPSVGESDDSLHNVVEVRVTIW